MPKPKIENLQSENFFTRNRAYDNFFVNSQTGKVAAYINLSGDGDGDGQMAWKRTAVIGMSATNAQSPHWMGSPGLWLWHVYACADGISQAAPQQNFA